MAIQFLTDVNADSGTLYVDSINNEVGIGTTSPSAKLHVNGSTLLVTQGNETGLSINNDTYIYKIGDISGGENQSFMEIDSANQKTIFNNTNVGIGTTSPSRKLQVVGTDGVAKFYYNSSFTNAQYSAVDIGMMTSGTAANGFGPKITFRMGGNGFDGFAAGTIGTIRNGADNSHNLNFGTSSNGNMSTKMTITNVGQVGIGVTSPVAGLDVLTGGLAGNFYSSQSTGLQVKGGGNGQDIARFLNSSGSTVATLDTNGRLGIGTTSPSEALDVNGTVDLNNLKISTSQGSDGQVLTSTGSGIAWENVSVSGFLPTTGGTMTGDIRFNDNVYARFGSTGTGDLIIGHADFGSPYSVILENGSGDLKIQATNLLLESANGETYVDCNFNSSVDLYHNNVKKFETLSTGVAVTGKLGIDTTSPNAQLDVFNNNDQTSTLRLSTSGNSGGDVSGEISFAFDGTTVGAKIQSIINANEDGTDLKLDCANTTLTGDLTVTGGDISLSGTGRIQGVDTVSASTDAANKAYVDAHTPANTQTIITSNFSDDTNTMNSLRIPFNNLVETTSNQYYNSFDCPADGSIKRVRFHNTSGSASTSFSVNFQIYKNANYSSPTTSGAISVSSGQVEWEPSSYAFSKGDSLQFGYSKSAINKYLRGVSATIIVEFEQV